MESFLDETDGSTEDIPGKKKSKLKSLKSRLFGKSKRAGGEDNAKLSQSSSNITAGQGLGSDEDLACSQGMMGSRALSHDSIFLADQVVSDAEPAKVLSNENVHSNIKALQMKLQQQKFHFGPPPRVLPARQPEDQGSYSEDVSLTHSLAEISEGHTTTQGALSKAISQSSHFPPSPIPKPTLTKLVSSTPSSSFISYISPPPVVEPPLDTSGSFVSYISPPPVVKPPLDTSGSFVSYISPPPVVKPPLDTSGSFVSYISPPPVVKPPLNTSGSFVSYISPPPVVKPPLDTSSSFISYISPPLDFGSPPQFTPCLDTSAARHRMSVKPRNQRASTKGRRHPTTDSYLHTINDINHPVLEKEEEQNLTAHEEMINLHSTQILETGQGETNGTVTSQRLPFKSQERAPITSEQSEAQAAPESSSPTFSHQDHSLPGRASSVFTQVLGIKPHRPVDVMSNEQPQSDLEEKREDPGDFDLQVVSRDSTNALNKNGTTDVKSTEVPVPSSLPHTSWGSVIAFRSSSVCQQVQGHAETIGGIQRSALGSGPFHVSVTTARDRERPRSSSLVEMLGLTGPKVNTNGSAEDISLSSSMSQREKKSQMEEGIKLRDVKPRGATIAVGGQGVLPKGSVLLYDRRGSLKRGESSRSVPTNTGALAGMEVEESQEVVEEVIEAEEVQEEVGKTTFGIKLRSTSRSKKMQSDTEMGSPTASTAPYNFTSKSVLAGEQSDKQKEQGIGNNAGYISKKPSTNISLTPTTFGELRQTDGTSTSSGSSQPDKHNPLAAGDPHTIPTDVSTISNPKEETVPIAPQEPQSASQTAPPEISWMSLAMEKTRSLQQLLTGRFPRDFTTASRPQTQGQPVNQGQTVSRSQKVTQSDMLIGTQMQAVKTQQSATQLQAATQQSTDTVTPPTIQSGSQTQTTKTSLMPTTLQQKPSVSPSTQSHTSREPKQSNDPSLKSNITQPVTQSPLHYSLQAETTPQFAQGSAALSLAQYYLSSGQHAKPLQPSWSDRGLQLKSATSSPTPVSNTASTSAPPPVSALGSGERTTAIQRKEGPSLSERRAFFAGSVGEKAALLEKQAELATPPGTKETRTPTESPASASITPLIKDTKQEGRPGVKLAESSPTKVPDKPVSSEDKWLRKNVTSSSPVSSSPMLQSPLRSMSDSNQPSWMELAKRKSMAWNDKNMD